MFDENLGANDSLNNTATNKNKDVTSDLLGDFADLLGDVDSPKVEQPASATPQKEIFDNFGVEPEVVVDETVSQTVETEPVTVQPVQFAAFDVNSQTSGEENQNLDLLMDVKLQLTVELGRCELPIKKVLELTRGSIIELDKVAGEPVALYANGKHVANGEVVVIDDNFGLRVTNISDPEERMKGLQ